MIVSSIDIGTNTVLMLVAEVDTENKKLVTLSNHYTIPRIGKGLKPGKPVSRQKVDELLTILKEFRNLSLMAGSDVILATATNAMRIASNSEEIQSEVKEKTGIEIEIIPGELEAEYSFLGAASDCKEDEKVLVIDIGGGSTEIIYGHYRKITYKKSFQTGVVSSTEEFLVSDPPDSDQLISLNDHLSKTFDELNSRNIKPDKTVAIAGTPTTLACIKLGLKSFDEELIEGSILKISDLEKFTTKFSVLTIKKINEAYPQIVKGREDVILAGTLILKKILEMTGVDETVVSTKGIRYGAIHYKYFR